jgi:DNA-binding NarL/FixJ family response regulator
MSRLRSKYGESLNPEMASMRIVIVDDHEVARRGIRLVLAANPSLEIVAEIADGEKAVQEVRDLHPDIILMDISLPGMSGIEAASSIRKNSPDSRIIFVSQHNSALLAKDALRTGASGYVVKSDAGHDLLPAIEAVQEGRTFVSPGLVTRGVQ